MAGKPLVGIHVASGRKYAISCQSIFLPKREEGKTIRHSVILKEGVRDAGVIFASCPEHLDTRELLKEPAPRKKFQFFVGRLVNGDMEFLHCG
jgi:hypothetical protein